MTTPDDTPPDDPLLDATADFVEALVSGAPPAHLPDPVALGIHGPADQARWHQLVGCALLLATANADPAEPDRAQPAPSAPPHVPGFDVCQELGRGGMGVVYAADDLTLRRTVALKVLRSGRLADPADQARILAEAYTVARIEHPHIVRIYQTGVHDGVPFLVLELVGGPSLAARLAGRPTPPTDAARLVAVLARAVQFAHDQGVVHRDLKPANVLLHGPRGVGAGGEDCVTLGGEAFVPKISDFGLAKRLSQDAGLTADGAIVGTPEYMAPEQSAGSPTAVGLAADVYALGAILYECLTGRPPFQGPTALDVIQQVRTDDPVRPRRLQPRVPVDLETVCLKCLEKEPTRRYESAQGLADDLQRFLAGVSVRARPVGGVGRAVKWTRRRPAVAGLLAAVVAVTLSGISLVLWQWRAALAARAETEQLLYVTRMSRVRQAWQDGEIGRARQLLDLYRGSAPGARDPRGFEWHYWDRQTHAELLAVPLLDAHSLAVSPDGRQVVAASPLSGRLLAFDPNTGREVWRLSDVPDISVAYAPDGRRLAAGGSDGAIRLRDAVTGAVLRETPGHGPPVACVAFHPQGQLLASCAHAGNPAGAIKLWGAATGQELQELPCSAPTGGLTFSPDWRFLAVCTETQVILHEVTDGRLRVLWSSDQYGSKPTFSPDSRRLAIDGPANRIRIVEAATGREQLTLGSFPGGGPKAFSPDGRLLAGGFWPGAVRVWDAASGAERATWRAHERGVDALAFLPDGWRVVTGNQDGTVKVWAVTADLDRFPLPRDAGDTRLYRIAVRPNGREVAAAGADGAVRRWDPRTGRELPPLQAHEGQLYALAYSPDGRRLAAAGGPDVRRKGGDYHISIWGDGGGEPLRLEGSENWVWSVAFHPGGHRLASAGSERTVRIWDLATRRTVRTLGGFGARVPCVVYSPDGRRLAATCSDGQVRVFDAADRGAEEPLLTLSGHDSEVFSVAYSPDGGLLASTGGDGTVRVWDAHAGTLRRVLTGHTREAWGAAFSPCGRRLATCSHDATIRLWDVASGEEVLVVRDETVSAFINPAFGPGGDWLVAASQGGGVRLLDARPRTPERDAERVALGLLRSLTGQSLSRTEKERRVLDDTTITDATRRAALQLLGGKPVPRD